MGFYMEPFSAAIYEEPFQKPPIINAGTLNGSPKIGALYS